MQSNNKNFKIDAYTNFNAYYIGINIEHVHRYEHKRKDKQVGGGINKKNSPNSFGQKLIFLRSLSPNT